MKYLAIFILAFSALQLIIALLNRFLRSKYNAYVPESNDLISVIIPARNEEKNIGSILNDLLLQNYKNLEIIVVNDQSDDKTSEIVNSFAVNDPRIRLINTTGPKAGWLGKNYACYNASTEAKGKYFLFIDADVRMNDRLIFNALGYFQHKRINFFSIFPTQTMKSNGEKSVIPLMNYILLTLLPLFLVKMSKFTSLSAANGQFMFFDREVYKALQPHKTFRNEKVEDIKTARLLKKYGFRIDCLIADENLSCRMYTNYKDAVSGFSKNMAAFFGGSHLLGLLFWMITTFGFILIWIYLPWYLLILFLAGGLISRILISKESNQNILENIWFLVPQQLNLGIILITSLIKRNTKTLEWKGRNIS